MFGIILVYIVEGLVKRRLYGSTVEAELDWQKLRTSRKPLAVFKFENVMSDSLEISERLLEYKFNKFADWQKVPDSHWPDFIKEQVAQQTNNPDYLGCRLEYWKEAKVYMLSYIWKTDVGMKLYQHVLLGSTDGAARWYEFD